MKVTFYVSDSGEPADDNVVADMKLVLVRHSGTDGGADLGAFNGYKEVWARIKKAVGEQSYADVEVQPGKCDSAKCRDAVAKIRAEVTRLRA